MSAPLYPLLFLASLLLGMWICERGSADPALARTTYLAGTAGGILGARLWYSAQYGALFIRGGFSYYGFGLGAAITLCAFHRLRHRRWAETDFPDAVAPALALGSAVHRVGCFYTGCCFGKVCQLPWAIRYGPGSNAFAKQVSDGLIEPTAASTLPIHPTQLYGSLTGLAVFAVLLWLRNRRPFTLLRYELFLGTALFYSVYRFLLEFLRDDAGGRSFGPLTFSQATSLVVLLVTGAFLILRRRRFRAGDDSLRLRPEESRFRPPENEQG